MSERKKGKKINWECGIDIVFTGGEESDFFQMLPMLPVKGMEQWDQSWWLPIYLWLRFQITVDAFLCACGIFGNIIFPKCWVAWVVCLFHSQLPWLADGFCNHSEVTECFWIVGVSIRCHINHRSLSWGALYFPVLHVDPKKASLCSVGRKDCSFAAMKNTGFWSHKPFHCSS